MNNIVVVGSGIVVSGNTVPFISSPTTHNPGIQGVVRIAGSQTFTAYASKGNFIIGSSTYSIGGPAATLNDHIISAISSGVVIGGSTVEYTSQRLSLYPLLAY